MIINDSYMRIVLPEDISSRIDRFISGKLDFPFIEKAEILHILYIYGKTDKVKSEKEISEAIDLARRTAEQMSRDIQSYKSGPKTRMDSEFIRSKFINRQLQIAVEQKEITRQAVLNDPVTLADSFALHIAYYEQDFFFQVFGPIKPDQLLKDIREELEHRMVMIGYNKKDENSLPFQHALIPLYIWMKENKLKA